MRKYVLRLLNLTHPLAGRTRYDGTYVVSYRPGDTGSYGAYNGGTLITTSDARQALKFDTPAGAMALWNTQAPKPYSMRPDGKPNKPLTAYNVEVMPVED